MTLAIIGSATGLAALLLLFTVDWRITVGLLGLWLADLCLNAELRARRPR